MQSREDGKPTSQILQQFQNGDAKTQAQAFAQHGITPASQPHLIISVDPAAGLTRHHLDEAARWLLTLNDSE